LELLLDQIVAVPLDEVDLRPLRLPAQRLELLAVVGHRQVLGADPVVEEIAHEVEGVALLLEEPRPRAVRRRIARAEMHVADEERARHRVSIPAVRRTYQLLIPVGWPQEASVQRSNFCGLWIPGQR